MEQKINIAELLKDCPKGMELYSPIFGEVYLDKIRPHLAIVVTTDKEQGDFKEEFLYDGRYGMNGECMLFPSKGKTTWEGFVPPCKFKDGDVIFTHANCLKVGLCNTWISIYQENRDGRIMTYVNYDVDYAVNGDNYYGDVDGGFLCMENDIIHQRYATEEEKQKLFDAIKVNGYKWNAETKTLEKLVKPKFKVGDRIVKQNSISNLWIVSSINSQYYGLNLLKGGESIGVLSISEQDDWELASNIEPKFKAGDKVKDKNNRIWFIVQVSEKHFNISRIPNPESAEGSGYYVPIEDQDEYELVPDKFNITTLVPFESRVLVRDTNIDKWKSNFWGFYNIDYAMTYPYECCGGSFAQCIPYEGNEHLFGTTNDCDDFYKTWK